MKVNIYYINRKGESHTVHNVYLASGLRWVEGILYGGGEITGIIDVEKDL